FLEFEWPNGASESSSVTILISGTSLMGEVVGLETHTDLWVQPGSLAGKTLLDLGEPDGHTLEFPPHSGAFVFDGLRPGNYVLRYVPESGGQSSEEAMLEALAWEFVVGPDTEP